MSMKQFIQRVFTPTEAETIIKGLTANIENHEELLSEFYSTGDGDLSGSKIYKEVDISLRSNRYLDGDYRGQLIRFVRTAVESIAKEKNDILSMYEKTFNKEVVAEGLDYRRVSLLQLAAGYDFFFDYAVKLAAVLHAEGTKDVYANKSLHEKYTAFVTRPEHLEAFGFMLTVANTKVKDIRSKIEALKDIPFIADQADMMEQTYRDRVDPFKMNLMPVIGHIALFIGGMLNEWTKYRHDRAKHLLERAKVERLYLMRAKEGASPEELAALEKQINHHNKRITVLEEKIRNLQDDM